MYRVSVKISRLALGGVFGLYIFPSILVVLFIVTSQNIDSNIFGMKTDKSSRIK